MASYRRDFLKAAITVCATGGVASAAKRRMFVSLNGSLTSGKVMWSEFVRLAGRLGYGGADLSLDPAMKEGVEATKALYAESKIRPGVANLPGNVTRDDAAFEASLSKIEDGAKFAAAVGCPRMMLVFPSASATPKAEYRKILKDRLMRVSEILGRSKVRLGLEYLGPLHIRKSQPHEFIYRMDETLAFAKECGPNIGVHLDCWHWHHSGGTVADIIAAGKSRIVSIHVSDAKKQPAEEVRDNQRLMPGEGVIDLNGFFQALKKIGYEDAISPEPLGRVSKEMSAEEGAKLGLDTTLAAMRKAGVA